jgi:hypothetical protein
VSLSGLFRTYVQVAAALQAGLPSKGGGGGGCCCGGVRREESPKTTGALQLMGGQGGGENAIIKIKRQTSWDPALR